MSQCGCPDSVLGLTLPAGHCTPLGMILNSRPQHFGVEGSVTFPSALWGPVCGAGRQVRGGAWQGLLKMTENVGPMGPGTSPTEVSFWGECNGGGVRWKLKATRAGWVPSSQYCLEFQHWAPSPDSHPHLGPKLVQVDPLGSAFSCVSAIPQKPYQGTNPILGHGFRCQGDSWQAPETVSNHA